MTKSTGGQWWRWPLIPFASLIGAALGAAVISGINWFFMKIHGGYAEDGWWYLYIKPTIHAAVFGFLYGWIACYVAPKGKVITGTVMTTILAVLGSILLAFAWMAPATTIGECVQATIGLIVAIAGSVGAVLVSKEEEEEKAKWQEERLASFQKQSPMVSDDFPTEKPFP